MKSREIYFAKNTIMLFISKFFTQFLSLLILPIITSSVSTNVYGEFDLISTYAFLIVSFMSLKIENGMFRFLIDVRNDEDGRSKVISNGLVLMFCQLLIFSILYFLISNLISVKYIFFIYFYALFSLIFNTFLEIARGVGKNIDYSIASLISGCLNLVLCLFLVLQMRLGLRGLIISGIIANLFASIFIILKNNFYMDIRLNLLDRNFGLELLKYSFPLVPNSLSSWILSISDKLMISFFIGTVANGIYAISTKFSILLSHIYGVFNLSWTESVSLNINNEDSSQFISNLFNKIFFLCFSFCIIMISFMPFIFDILVHSNFLDSYNYIPLLIIGVIFEIFSSLLGGIYTSLKLTKNIAITTITAGIINILINIIFMRKYGIIVACISTIVSYFIISVYRFFDIKKYVKLKLNYKLFILSFLFLIVCIFIYYSNSFLYFIFNLIISIIFVLFLNKDIIKIFIKKI